MFFSLKLWKKLMDAYVKYQLAAALFEENPEYEKICEYISKNFSKMTERLLLDKHDFNVRHFCTVLNSGKFLKKSSAGKILDIVLNKKLKEYCRNSGF